MGNLTCADSAITSGKEIKAELLRRLDPHKRRSRNSESLKVIPRIVCVDGLEISVQASKYHYCSPRGDYGAWYEVEVGFPTREIKEFMPFIDGSHSDPTQSVYGYVPLRLVCEVIASAGGLLPEAELSA